MVKNSSDELKRFKCKKKMSFLIVQKFNGHEMTNGHEMNGKSVIHSY